jgi:hypothetical protein
MLTWRAYQRGWQTWAFSSPASSAASPSTDTRERPPQQQQQPVRPTSRAARTTTGSAVLRGQHARGGTTINVAVSGAGVGDTRAPLGARTASGQSEPTQRQLDYIAVLALRQGLDAHELTAAVTTKAEASELIDRLLARRWQ